MKKIEMKFETLAIKSTEASHTDIHSVSTPLYLSTTFQRSEDGSFKDDFQYSRLNNPNRKILESSIALLEGGEIGFSFSSGMAAISAVFQSLKPGDHVLLPDDVFYNVHMLVSEVFEEWGLEYTSVNMADSNEVADSFKQNTALVWIETPSNPQLKITDIKEIAKMAKRNNSLVAVDNTWPSPVLQSPITMGADIVIHSTTKYLGGHSDVINGCLVLKTKNELAQKIKQVQILSGGIPSPFDCWLVSRGIKTLYLRIMAQTKSASILAEYLDKHPMIEQVNYPGLKSHPQHNVAKKQMKNGYGGMMSVLVKGDKDTAMSISNKLNLFTTATSLGSVESLIEHRRSVEGSNSKTPENLLRISVGLEHIDDLIADWDQALRIT